MIKSQLENVGITAFIKDDIMGTLNPWHTAPGGVGSVKVIVSDCDIDKAKLIIDEYNELKEVK